MVNISLPAESVPNQWAFDGGWLEILKFVDPKISLEYGDIRGIIRLKKKIKDKTKRAVLLVLLKDLLTSKFYPFINKDI